jgi:hypothetical protein
MISVLFIFKLNKLGSNILNILSLLNFFEVEKMNKKGIECMQELGADLNDLR